MVRKPPGVRTSRGGFLRRAGFPAELCARVSHRRPPSYLLEGGVGTPFPLCSSRETRTKETRPGRTERRKMDGILITSEQGMLYRNNRDISFPPSHSPPQEKEESAPLPSLATLASLAALALSRNDFKLGTKRSSRVNCFAPTFNATSFL